jgi:hypothetical protein
LAVAWHLDRNEQDFREFRAQLGHWIDANPYPCGVNWACPMDVAIRVVNWITALGIFQDALAALDPKDRIFEHIDRAIWDHGWHVARHLEASGPRCPRGGNHLYADLCGLLATGLYFRDCSSGRRWLSMARVGIEAQTLRQFLDDGGPGESSTSYHRLLLEMAVWVRSTLSHHGIPLSAASNRRVSQAIAFCRDVADHAGNSPNIGDNDSGRLLVLIRDDEGKHNYLWEENPQGIPGIHKRLLSGTTRPSPPAPPSHTYPSSGFHIIRSSRWHVCIRAGRIGHGGVHSHCDQLSLVCSLDGMPVLVDLGSFVYTPDPDERNRFRSGGSHNIVIPDEMEQQILGSGRQGVFVMKSQNEATVDAITRNQHGGNFKGRFDYQGRNDRVAWEREIEVADSHLRVRDTLRLPREMRLWWRFHLAPGVSADCLNQGIRLRTDQENIEVIGSEGSHLELEGGHYSGGYGNKTPIKVISLQLQTNASGEITREFSFHAGLPSDNP